MAKQERFPALDKNNKPYTGVFYVVGQRIGGEGTEKIYYIRYKRDGKLIEEKAGRQFKDAMTSAKANAMRGERITGKEASNSEKRAQVEATRLEAEGKMTVGKIWEKYAAAHTEGKNLAKDRSKYLVHIAPIFEGMIPSEITTAHIEGMKAGMAKIGRAPATIQRAMVILRAVINYGVLHGMCPSIDPGKLQFKTMKVDNSKTELLTDMELARLLQALDEEPDQNAAALIRLALVTGMRKGALLALQWDDCDFNHGIITLRGEAAKKGKTGYIPMSAAARAVLERIERADSLFVFPGRNGGQRKDFRRIAWRVKKKAQLPDDFRPLHGLRHNYASRLASSGQVDMCTLQKLLTHESPAMTQRYAHLHDDALRRAAAVADAVLTPKKKAESTS